MRFAERSHRPPARKRKLRFLPEEMGGPRRDREFTVSLEVSATVTAYVNATGQDEEAAARSARDNLESYEIRDAVNTGNLSEFIDVLNTVERSTSENSSSKASRWRGALGAPLVETRFDTRNMRAPRPSPRHRIGVCVPTLTIPPSDPR